MTSPPSLQLVDACACQNPERVEWKEEIGADDQRKSRNLRKEFVGNHHGKHQERNNHDRSQDDKRGGHESLRTGAGDCGAWRFRVFRWVQWRSRRATSDKSIMIPASAACGSMQSRFGWRGVEKIRSRPRHGGRLHGRLFQGFSDVADFNRGHEDCQSCRDQIDAYDKAERPARTQWPEADDEPRKNEIRDSAREQPAP